MFERFTKDARAVTLDAQREAAALGARQVDAEHLLLALAARGVAGLDHTGVLEALEDEQRRSLAAVGVALDDFDLPAPRPTDPRRLRFGAGAKTGLERAMRAALDRHDRHITPAHILLGLVRAPRGTVPRALAGAGISTHELSRAASASIP